LPCLLLRVVRAINWLHEEQDSSQIVVRATSDIYNGDISEKGTSCCGSDGEIVVELNILQEKAVEATKQKKKKGGKISL
jgi:hypothetical protein